MEITHRPEKSFDELALCLTISYTSPRLKLKDKIASA